MIEGRPDLVSVQAGFVKLDLNELLGAGSGGSGVVRTRRWRWSGNRGR